MRNPKDGAVTCPICQSLALTEMLFGNPVKVKCWGCGHTGMYDDWLMIEELRAKLRYPDGDA